MRHGEQLVLHELSVDALRQLLRNQSPQHRLDRTLADPARVGDSQSPCRPRRRYVAHSPS